MQKIGFSEALDKIIENHPQYDREGYIFVRDALEFTVKKQKKEKGEGSRHVNAGELLEGFRAYSLKQFGPMTTTVLEFWGIRNCQDVGNIVFNLIEGKIFGKSDHDSIEDFANGFDFQEAFVRPFQPAARRVSEESQKRGRMEKLQ